MLSGGQSELAISSVPSSVVGTQQLLKPFYFPGFYIHLTVPGLPVIARACVFSRTDLIFKKPLATGSMPRMVPSSLEIYLQTAPAFCCISQHTPRKCLNQT